MNPQLQFIEGIFEPIKQQIINFEDCSKFYNDFAETIDEKLFNDIVSNFPELKRKSIFNRFRNTEDIKKQLAYSLFKIYKNIILQNTENVFENKNSNNPIQPEIQQPEQPQPEPETLTVDKKQLPKKTVKEIPDNELSDINKKKIL